MSILKIGTRLIKSFDTNRGLRRIITETIDGKIFTNIYDETGNLLRQRVKQITRYPVGDKNVISVKKVSDKFDKDNRYATETKKNFIDKVYDKAGEMLGLRKETGDVGSSMKTIKKQCLVPTKQKLENGRLEGPKYLEQVSRDFSSTKRFDCGKVERKSVSSKASYTDGTTVECNNTTLYNNKGLPMPQGMAWDKAKNKSIAEMNKIHMTVAPDVPYAADGSGLEFLNNQYIKYEKPLNGLDEYLV